MSNQQLLIPNSSIDQGEIDENFRAVARTINDLNDASGVGELAYIEDVIGQAGFNATPSSYTPLTVTLVTVRAQIIQVRAVCQLNQKTAGGTAAVYIYEGSSIVAEANDTLVTNAYGPVIAERRIAATPGTHIYQVKVNSTGGTVDAVIIDAVPNFLEVIGKGFSA